MLTLSLTVTSEGITITDSGSILTAITAIGIDPLACRVMLSVLDGDLRTNYTTSLIELVVPNPVVEILTLQDGAYFFSWRVQNSNNADYDVNVYPSLKSLVVFYAEERAARTYLREQQLTFFSNEKAHDYRKVQLLLDEAQQALRDNNPVHYTYLVRQCLPTTSICQH